MSHVDEAGALVVRFRDEALRTVMAVVPGLRLQAGVLLIVLAAIFGLMVLVPFVVFIVGAEFRPRDLLFLLLLAGPAALLVAGVRRLRHPFTVNPVALTVTPALVVFEERMSGGSARIAFPYAEWDRATTRVRLLPPSGIFGQRLEFRNDAQRKPYLYPVDSLDTPPDVIVAAVERR